MSMWRNTLKNLFSKPATRLYPAVPANLAEDTRGRIVYNMDKCIFCGLCERRCPTNAIIMDKANKRQMVSRARCIACRVCVENCPTDAIDMRPEYAPPATAPELHVYSTKLTEHQYTVLSLPVFERGKAPPKPSEPREEQPEGKLETTKVEGRITLDSPASSIMSTRVLTLYEDDTVRKALQIMVNQKIGGLPVVDVNFKVLGIVTGTDVAKAAGKEKEGILTFLFPKDGRKSADQADEAKLRKTMDKPVREIMTSPVITSLPNVPLRDIAGIMGKNGFDRVPIVDADGRLVGIVTRRDILRAIATSLDACPP